MAVKIGHSSIDEHGKISGGAAGDQTGREVCTRDFYMHSKGWDVLRAKDPSVAEKIAKCMEDACANDCIGYDQSQRLTLYDTVKSLNFYCDINTLKTKVECDCSSLVRVCLAYAGIHVANFNTASEKSVIMANGKFGLVECKADGSNLKRGDILVTKTKGHTVVVLTNGADYDKEEKIKMKVLKKGSTGNHVTIFESMMKELGYYTGKIDTDFGNMCVTACNKFQEKYPECGYNGKPDGVFGKKSWDKLLSLFEG